MSQQKLSPKELIELDNLNELKNFLLTLKDKYIKRNQDRWNGFDAGVIGTIDIIYMKVDEIQNGKEGV